MVMTWTAVTTSSTVTSSREYHVVRRWLLIMVRLWRSLLRCRYFCDPEITCMNSDNDSMVLETSSAWDFCASSELLAVSFPFGTLREATAGLRKCASVK
eukprot:CAMPEP_0202347500 /NCGR_PEP_ID=MMETSP1126-20121109/5834_1 /ASSEMBLY_ACC=CAM_ASM_000457 /TAXON_ID=3047 /ORGANISM="Dunaliella tertiolecta, Strain CCMP1320" /LENGTH=98 /DNA_ID=CAMNT_0048939057 /DNA_START=313 /DNA_END=609 /DNA_ORIENTATION=+